MFKLSKLLEYNEVVIQCHDNPDADAIASAFGIHTYLTRNGKSPKIIYSGFEPIKKCNLKLMLEWLNIPIEYIKNPKSIRPEFLVCVDCQYGEGNVTKIKSKSIAIIDHHLQVVSDDEYNLLNIHSGLGSCSTLVWSMLREEGFSFDERKDIPAALYYGLLTDTNNFSEINHPLDKDMRDALQPFCDRGIIKRLANCNLTIDELEIAGVALIRNIFDTNKRYAIFKAENCDPNILGFVSDLGLQVDVVDICLVYSEKKNGAKLSARSCSREVMANEFVEYITRDVGSGGGHREKAGGFIQETIVEELGYSIDEYIKMKAAEYFDTYDVIYAANHNIDTAQMKRYIKKSVPLGFICSADIFEKGTPLMLRTLEGDENVIASPEIYLMIGIQGEVYPIKMEKFQSYYTVCSNMEATENIKTEYSYNPTVKNELTGEVRQLKEFMKYCVSNGTAPIYASPLTRNTKVFTEWNIHGYMYGEPGDYLAVKCNDIQDVYIIQDCVFDKTYEEIA